MQLLNTETMDRTQPSVEDDDIDVFARRRAADQDKYVIAADAPVLPSLASRGEVELVVKDDGLSMVLFDTTLPDAVHWVEYDMDIDSLTFVTWRGAIFSLGMRIHKPFRKYLSKKNEIYLIEMEQGKTIKMMDMVPLIVRRIGI